MDIQLTEKARSRLQSYQLGQEKFLRIAVVSGGCSGNTYHAVIDHELKPNDEVVYEAGDIRIVADARSALFIDGLNIDYSDDLIKAGFRLSNKHASSSCGCGASFKI
jgi:iron-sulfur cluster assembly protein